MRLPLILAAVGTGCGLTSEDPESFDQDTDYDDGIHLGDEVDDGTFAMKLVASTTVTDPSPLGDDTAVSSVVSWLRVTWHRDGTEVVWQEQTCDLWSNEVFSTVTSYPEAFLDAIPVRERVGSLSEATTGATLTAGPWVDLLGVELADPAGDPLPTAPTDASVTDSDDDGHPGVTVHIQQSMLGAGDVYVAQRSTTVLTGTVIDADRIEGRVDMTSEQSILDATTWWLKLDTHAEPNDDPAHNFFILQRVDDADTCADILADREALF